MAIVHGGDIFALARERGWDWREVLDCSASINPLGPAPGVAAAICQAIERVVHYPEREPVLLRRALAREWQLDEEQILLGNGATDLIFFAARVLAHSPVTLALPVFSEFNRAFPGAAHASLTDCSSWPTKGLLVLTRPANPTGSTLGLEVIRGFLETAETALLIDESFLEFFGAAFGGRIDGRISAATYVHFALTDEILRTSGSACGRAYRLAQKRARVATAA